MKNPTKAVEPVVEYATPEEIHEARLLYADGSNDNIEIDDNAQASRADDGVWVAAWVWVADEEEEEEDYE